MIDFREPKLKVKRANQHIADLNREVLAYTRKDPYVVIVDGKSDPGYQLLRVKERLPQPEHWPLLIGDAIHNLRSALDILACDVMRHHGFGIASVHFPFAPSLEDLEATIVRRTVHRAGPEVVEIFRALKPYRGGDDLLYAIHDLDVRDKHKLLTPVIHLAGVTGVRLFNPDGSPNIIFAPGAKMLIDSEDRIIIRAELGIKFQYDRKAPFEVLFGEGPSCNNPVVPTLLQMSELTRQIIAVFENCISHPGPPAPPRYSQ